MSDELILEFEDEYIGSAVSPTVEVTETETDVNINITDFRGDHEFSIQKTDQAISDAEAAATNANTAAANATSTANQAAQYARTTADQAAADAQETADAAAGRADTAAASATSAAQAATAAAGTANTAASNADAKAALADSKATLADTAATTANQAAEAAEAAKTAANTAAGQATTAATNATTAAGQANTAATNADTKAALADTAATNADTATAAANTATTNATNAAQAANNAADCAIEAADDMPKLIGTVDTVQTVNDAWPTTLHGATLYGKSVQDGTPTPDNPVPVQVVGGRNLYNPATRINGYWINDSGVIGTDRNSCYSDKIPVTVGEKYSFAITVYGETFKRVVAYDANDSFVALLTKLPIHIGEHENATVTIPPNTAYVRISCTQNDQAVQLEAGTHATPYTPYGCIGLQTGDTVHAIDLQGHTLAGLRNDVRDYLTINAAGVKKIGQRVGVVDLGTLTWYYASGTSSRMYANLDGIIPTGSPSAVSNLMCTGFKPATYNAVAGHAEPNIICVHISAQVIWVYAPDMGADPAAFKNAVSGVMLYYELATPATIELGTITPPEIAPGDTLAMYASLDPEWAIEYTQDPTTVAHTLQSSIAPVEGSTASTNYAVGAYLMHGNQLYRVTSAIATGEAITPGSNCVACTVMGEVIRLTA